MAEMTREALRDRAVLLEKLEEWESLRGVTENAIRGLQGIRISIGWESVVRNAEVPASCVADLLKWIELVGDKVTGEAEITSDTFDGSNVKTLKERL